MSDNVAHALAGAAGGVVSLVVTYPLQTVTTRFQLQSRAGGDSFGYKSTFDAFQKILARDGIPGLYSGLSSAVFGTVIMNGVYYYCYEFIKGTIAVHGKARRLSTIDTIVCSTLAGVVTAIVTNPIWVVNTRVTAGLHKSTPDQSGSKLDQTGQPNRPTSATALFLHLLHTEGPTVLFRGLGPALLLVTNPVIQFSLYEYLVRTIRHRKRGAVLSDIDVLLLGALTKLAATLVTYPYIVLKSHIQVGGSGKSALTRLKEMWREGGLKTFYSGFGVKATQTVATSAVLFMAKHRIFLLVLALLRWYKLRHATKKSLRLQMAH